jgi:glycerol-3-phosphate dehydrogenase
VSGVAAAAAPNAAFTSPRGSVLGPATRAATLAAAGERIFDLLVVGGGVTGAGIALDAASRGLDVLLVERDDFASGTSSRSSKLIHGGLRYLEQRNFALVREALHERALLLTRVAPHLVHPVSFLLPLGRRWQRAYFGAGLVLYDGLGGRRRAVPCHRHLGRAATLAAAPALREDGIVGGIRYFDAQTDDARFVVTLVRTALAHGAAALSRVAVTGFLGDRRVEGASLRDVETDAAFEVRARATVLATGVWTNELEELAGVRRPVPIRASKGVHLLVPRDRLELRDALILRADRSVLLVIPWGAHWLIGTTDSEYELNGSEPVAAAADVDYLLSHVNRVLRRPLARADVTGVFAGLRPLVDPGGRNTAAVSREHVVREPRPGLVTIAGGKYTTYRVMAAAAVDAAARQIGARLERSRTGALPLLGADGLDAARCELARLGFEPAAADRLVGRYGGLAVEIGLQVLREPALADELPGAAPYLAAEAAHAVAYEGALHVEDVLARRTRISFEASDGGFAAAPLVAQTMARRLGWSPDRVQKEILRFRCWVERERALG